ncbi:MAG TPA: Hpt domain-containing protein [Bacteroidales bacterium]|jgi:HPt (histidine-containing phosphotransfer) domain-containing protein|nr:Hpt domain-containing protein [Bacteroidales bacterium]
MEYKYINTEYLDTVSGGDNNIIREIVDMFREQCKEIHEQMIAKLSEGDYRMLGMLAHKAKSSVAIMGMESMAAMLKTFELDAKEGRNPDSYSSYIERFRNETEAAVFELEDMIEKRRL